MSTGQLTALPERNLDCLRAVAVLTVLGFHAALTAHASDAAIATLARGGVVLFFVHTSLVLMSSLERGGGGPGTLWTFWMRRAFRIYPLAIAVVLLTVIARIPVRVPVAGVVAPYYPPTVGGVLANLTLTQNLFGIPNVSAPLWSLPLEVQMYVVLPLCYAIARRGAWWVALAFALASVAGVLAVRDATAWTRNLLFFAPCFLSGVLAYAMLRRGRRAPLPAAALPAVIALPLLLLVGCRLAAPQGMSNAVVVVSSWLVALLVGVGIAHTRELEPSWLTRAAKTVATYSYGIYLLHVPVLWLSFVVLRGLPIPVQVLVSVVALVGSTYAAYHLIEAPGIRMGQRRVHRRAMPLAATTPAP